MQQIRIRKFDPSTIKPYRIHILIGKRGCGKTTLLNDLLFHMKDSVDFAVGFCPTMESADMLRKSLPESCVFDRFVPSKIEQLVATAQRLVHTGKTRHLLIVADDCLYDKSVLKSTAFRNIMFNGRHLKCSVIIASQYSLDMTPDLRAQIDYCYLSRETSHVGKIKLWKNLVSAVGNYDDFSELFDRCTQNFECLCVDNTLQSSHVQDCIFWYKAKLEHPPFRVGSAVIHALDARYKRPKDQRQAGLVEPEPVVARKGRGSLSIVKEDDEERVSDSER
jgi:hypothetical protein